jgi:hypothetical protein
MSTSSHQIQAVAAEESDRVVLRDHRGGCSGATEEGPSTMASEVKLHHDRHTDVMYADFCFPAEHDHVDVMDIGDCLGFPGQIVARVNREKKIIYGLTVQNYSSFRWKIVWQYRMTSIQRALQLMMNVLRTCLWIDRGGRPAHLPA